MSEEGYEEKPSEENPILCDSCEWFIMKKNKAKCKYVKEKERIAMIKSGVQCPEYLRAHRLQV